MKEIKKKEVTTTSKQKVATGKIIFLSPIFFIFLSVSVLCRFGGPSTVVWLWLGSAPAQEGCNDL